jgi:hypothetical protein
MVASAQTPVKVRILLDGAPLSKAQAGSDVASDGTVMIQANKLYNLVQGAFYGSHTLELDIENAGLQAYTLTFG